MKVLLAIIGIVAVVFTLVGIVAMGDAAGRWYD